MPVYVDIHLKIELERSFEENMEPNEEKRDRMDLRFMFYAGLRKWKAMIIAGLIIAVLLGIYAIISSITASNDDYANWDRVVEIRDNKLKYSNSMDEAELDNVTIDKKISDQQEYLDKSIYINLDPYDIQCAEAEYYISTDYKILPGMDYQNMDFTDTIARSYVSLLTNADIMNEVAEKFGTQSRYLKEILSIYVSDRILTVKVIHSDVDTAQQILECVVGYLPSIGEDITKNIAEHSLGLINNTSYSYINLDLIDKQKEQNALLQSLNQTKTENNNIIDDATYNLRELDKDENALSNDTNVVFKTIKYSIVGLIAGVFMVYVCGCMAYVIGDRIYIGNEISDRFGMVIIGKIASGKNKNIIDKRISRIEGRCCDNSLNDNYQLIAENIMGMKEKYSSIYITGSISDTVIKNISEKISPMLKDIKVKAGSDIFNNAEAVKGLSDCEAVLFVEQSGISKYSVIQEEINKAEWLGKAIIGCVVIE